MLIENWLFPARCFVCQKKGDYLCSSCQKQLPRINSFFCPACQKPSYAGFTHRSCQKKTPLAGLFSLFHYSLPLKKIIAGFKFDLVEKALPSLSFWLAQELAARPILSYWRQEKFIFLPLPLHPWRKRWRGFNQTETWLAAVSRRLQLKFSPDLLTRLRLTRPQVGLKAQERWKNIGGAFAVKRGKKREIAGKNFVIFDDVWTTGATLTAAARALKKAGASLVWGLTVSR